MLKTFLFIATAFLICFQCSADDSAQLRSLDKHLVTSDKSFTENVKPLYTDFAIVGVLSFGFGAYAYFRPSHPNHDLGSALMIGGAGLGVASYGLYYFNNLWRWMHEHYLQMPEDTAEQKRDKIVYGEGTLDLYRSQSKALRIGEGVFFTALAAGLIFPTSQLDFVSGGLAALSLGAASYCFFHKQQPEREWIDYQSEQKHETAKFDFDLLPNVEQTPSGNVQPTLVLQTRVSW